MEKNINDGTPYDQKQSRTVQNWGKGGGIQNQNLTYGYNNMDCLFCKIVNGEINSYKIYEDDIVFVFLDINPNSAGDTLITTKKHYLDLDDIDINTLTHIMKVAKMLKLKIEEKLNCDGLTLIQNNGQMQEIKHFHLHLTPFYKNKKDKTLEEVYNLLK